MNVQKTLVEFFKGSCYSLSIAYVNSDPAIRDDMYYLLMDVVQGWRNGFIDNSGYVAKPHKYATMCRGEEKYYKDVEKVFIKSLDELPEEGEWIVEYQYNGGSHFVVCQKGRVIWDPWENSETVKNGKPVSYRKFIKY